MQTALEDPNHSLPTCARARLPPSAKVRYEENMSRHKQVRTTKQSVGRGAGAGATRAAAEAATAATDNRLSAVIEDATEEDTIEVTLERDDMSTSFGFGLATFADDTKFVSAVSPGGLADGQIRVKDIIVSANGLALKSLTHDDAVKHMIAGTLLNLQLKRPGSATLPEKRKRVVRRKDSIGKVKKSPVRRTSSGSGRRFSLRRRSSKKAADNESVEQSSTPPNPEVVMAEQLKEMRAKVIDVESQMAEAMNREIVLKQELHMIKTHQSARSEIDSTAFVWSANPSAPQSAPSSVLPVIHRLTRAKKRLAWSKALLDKLDAAATMQESEKGTTPPFKGSQTSNARQSDDDPPAREPPRAPLSNKVSPNSIPVAAQGRSTPTMPQPTRLPPSPPRATPENEAHETQASTPNKLAWNPEHSIFSDDDTAGIEADEKITEKVLAFAPTPNKLAWNPTHSIFSDDDDTSIEIDKQITEEILRIAETSQLSTRSSHDENDIPPPPPPRKVLNSDSSSTPVDLPATTVARSDLYVGLGHYNPAETSVNDPEDVEEELHFRLGDLMEIHTDPEDGFQEAELLTGPHKGQIGIVPSNWIRPSTDDEYERFVNGTYSTERKPHRKALLVAITYKDTALQLDGTLKDSHRVSSLLQSHCGFKQEEIRMSNEENGFTPTRANILSALAWLMEDCADGDELFLHVGAHGGQVRDRDGDESDGFDECLVPLDYKESGVISDDLLYNLLVAKIPVGAVLNCVLDTCHSGSALDIQYGWDGKGSMEAPVWRELSAKKASGGLVVCISGCQDNEESADTSAFSMVGTVDPVSGKRRLQSETRGALTSCIESALVAQNATTYGELFEYVLHKLQAKQELQQQPLLSCTQQLPLSTKLTFL